MATATTIVYFWAAGGAAAEIMDEGDYRGGPLVSPIFTLKARADAYRITNDDDEKERPGRGRVRVCGIRIKDWDGGEVYAATVCRCEIVALGIFGTRAAAQAAGDEAMEEFEPDIKAAAVVVGQQNLTPEQIYFEQVGVGSDY